MLQRRLLIALLLLACQSPVGAEPALVERYDGPSTTWSPVPNRFGVRVVQQERVRQDEHQGSGAELIRLTGPPGYSGMLLTPIGQAPVIEDLRIDARLRCDHPGVQLGMRVVFPRETDPNTGRPLAAIVRGDNRAVGTRVWETLSITRAVETVGRHARAIGSAQGHSIDDRGAFVDAVVLIVPSDPRGAAVWVDELTIHGLVRRTSGNQIAAGDASRAEPRKVQLTQKGLLVDGSPFFPRVITHLGEPLTDLKKLGFNTIAFSSPPPESLRQECAKLRLEILCPPPPASELAEPGAAAHWDGVLAWLLPAHADEHAVDSTAAIAESLRQSDTLLSRPLLARPTEAWAVWSRLADGLVVDAPWAPPSQMLPACRARFAEATRFSRPGTPIIAATPLSHSAQFLGQVTAFAPAGTVDAWRSPTDVIADATALATDGARGVWITRGAAFTGAEGDARVRQGLSLLNLNLTLLEPWLRDGQRAGEITARESSRSAVVLTRRRTRLLVPRARSDAASGAAGGLTFVAPGVPEAAKAYEFTPVSIRPIAINRLAGGSHVRVPNPDAWILITEDARAAAEVGRRVRSVAKRAEALQQAIAVSELRWAESHLSPLVLAAGAARSPDAAVLADARRTISLAKSAASTGDLDAAFHHAAAATTRLASWSRLRVAGANRPGVLDSSPLAGQASTIIDHHRLLQLIEPLTRHDNLLPGGGFEDHAQAAASGWRHVSREAGVGAVVSFSGQSPAVGERCLRIECPPGPEHAPPAALVEINSPEVNLSAGQLVEVTGMVRVESADAGGVLTIADNLGGPELALSLSQPLSWRSFRLLRRATDETPLRVTITAVGPVVAEVDALSVRTIELPGATKAAVLGEPALQRK